MTDTLRLARLSDRKALQDIWRAVFGDTDDEIDTFLKFYFDPQMTVIATSDGIPAAIGFILPSGHFCDSGGSVPCGMIYAVATLPEFRGRGIGASIVRELISIGRSAGIGAIVLHPAEDSLFEYYSDRSGLKTWFYMSERKYTRSPPGAKAIGLTPVADNEYRAVREKLLSGIPHIEFDSRALSYQAELCHRCGGGLFSAETSYGPACAIVEIETGGAVLIKELLAPDKSAEDIVSAIISKYPASEYRVRSPAGFDSRGSEARRFGMLMLSSEKRVAPIATENPPYPPETVLPWYGPAFD